MRMPGALALIALAAVATGSFAPFERVAAAQAHPTRKPTRAEERKERERKEAEEGAASEDAQSRPPADEAQKPEPEPAPAPIDDRVESARAIYVAGDLAITRSDLGGISDNTGFDRTVANGLLYGLATGIRLRDVRLGVRWRVYDTTEFTLWNVALSAGYGLPIRPVTPIFSAHVGYVFDQKMQAALFRSALPIGNVLPPDVDVKGLLVGIDVNASYWLTKFLRLGAFIGADLMFLSRETAPFPQSLFGPSPELSGHPIYAESGSGIGLNVNLGLRGAFDIGIR